MPATPHQGNTSKNAAKMPVCCRGASSGAIPSGERSRCWTKSPRRISGRRVQSAQCRRPCAHRRVPRVEVSTARRPCCGVPAGRGAARCGSCHRPRRSPKAGSLTSGSRLRKPRRRIAASCFCRVGNSHDSTPCMSVSSRRASCPARPGASRFCEGGIQYPMPCRAVPLSIDRRRRLEGISRRWFRGGVRGPLARRSSISSSQRIFATCAISCRNALAQPVAGAAMVCLEPR